MTDSSISSNNISRQTASYYLAFFSFGLVAAMLGPALPFLADHAGASISEASVLFIAGALGFFLGSNIAGFLYDRVKGNPVVAFSLAITGTAFFFIPLSKSIFQIFLLLVFNGIIFTSTALGGMSLPYLSGQLFQKISPYMVMYGLIVYLIINLVLTLINIKRLSNNSL